MSSSRSPIGVFDSGIGGLSVLDALRAELPRERFVYFADTAHAPYGERGDAFVAQRTLAIVADLIERHAIKALVVACNTATAAAIHLVRDRWPDMPVVGVEPALKPAVALSTSKHIGVLATRGTLESRKFKALHDSLASQATFRLVPCDGLASAIDAAASDRIAELCARYMRSAAPFGDAANEVDTLVLGCTHYPFVAAELRRHAGGAVRFIDTGAPVAQQTRRLLAAANLLANDDVELPTLLEASGSAAALTEAATRWLHPATALAH
ncbi:MAG: glutamate racemase [Variovorax sp.]